MRVLFGQGTPVPLRRALLGHEVFTAFELGWATLSNGALLAAAEEAFDVLVTTDRNLRFQQNLAGRRLAVLVLPTTSWPKLRMVQTRIAEAVDAMGPGDRMEIEMPSAQPPAPAS